MPIHHKTRANVSGRKERIRPMYLIQCLRWINDVTPRIQLSIFVTPTLAISGYVIYYFLRGWVFVCCFAFCSCYASRLTASCALHRHRFHKTCIRSGFPGPLRCPFGVQTHLHAPAAPPKYYFISGIKMFSEWVATCRAVLL